MFNIYFWMDGECFDADGYQAGLCKSLRGTVEVRKRINHGVIESFGTYWKSIVRGPLEDNPEEELADILRLYESEIKRAKNLMATRIVAEIVYEVASIDDIRGVYFSAEALSRFAHMGICLDVDIVRQLK